MSLVREWLTRFRWLRRSSTLRLAMILSAIFAVGFVIAIVVALGLGQRAIDARMDATLLSLAEGSDAAEAQTDSPAMILRPLDDLSGLPPEITRAAKRGGGTASLHFKFLGSDLWRVLVSRDSMDAPVVVAVPIEDSAEIRELLEGVLWSTAAIVLLATLLIGLWAGLLAQRRLVRINTTLDQLAQGDLTARTGQTQARDDLDDIAQNLDQTASEIERLVSQTRHLSASIAHDLRTPLARLRAQLEMLPAGEERGAALEEAERLSGIFDTIMRVARIEAGQGRDGFEPVGLGDLAEDLADTFGPVIEDAGKTLVLDVSNAQEVEADRGMLVQAVANLIQNAIKHGGDQITFFARGASLGVSDNGVGVAPEQLGEIVKPMVRLDAARSTAGSGLGLALVKAVADRHGAKLELSNAEPQGLQVKLDFTEM